MIPSRASPNILQGCHLGAIHTAQDRIWKPFTCQLSVILSRALRRLRGAGGTKRLKHSNAITFCASHLLSCAPPSLMVATAAAGSESESASETTADWVPLTGQTSRITFKSPPQPTPHPSTSTSLYTQRPSGHWAFIRYHRLSARVGRESCQSLGAGPREGNLRHPHTNTHSAAGSGCPHAHA
jgi:hypothetical protein